MSGPEAPPDLPPDEGHEDDTHRSPRLLLALVTGMLLAGTTVTSAHAEDGFRFWGYYQWTRGKWVVRQHGPDKVVPADGLVEGWRFAVGGKNPRMPRAAGDFAADLCPGPGGDREEAGRHW